MKGMSKVTEYLKEHDSVGGWVKGFGIEFNNDKEARKLDFTQIELNPKRVQYFQRYLEKDFNECFIFGQGTEHILTMGARYRAPGRWLDIGSGTSPLFWATAFDKIEAVTCIDLVPEALYVFDRFRSSEAVPKCYAEALRIGGNSPASLAKIRAARWAYHQCNVLSPWAPYFAGLRFDMITAYAVFGLAPNEEGYRKCFQNMRDAARGSKVILGADWIRSNAFVDYEGHDNRYISIDVCETAAKDAGFAVIECEYYDILGDPLYSGVVSWAVRESAIQ